MSHLTGDNKSYAKMKLVRTLRWENDLPTPIKKDSSYKPIVRKERKFSKLKIPKSIQANLPFTSKPKLEKARQRKSYDQKRAVVMTDKQRRTVTLLQELATIKRDKGKKRKEKLVERQKQYKERLAAEEQQRSTRIRAQMKEVYRARGKEEKRKAAAQNRVRPEPKRRKDRD
eukprot:m.152036 g.152036  ORF g.152036 m.152036 type:complete len:172 (-) comp13297_c1_seq6:314-829(-)